MDQDTYNSALADMATIAPKSVPWLLEHADPKHWAELSFDGERYGHLTSNIAESLNAWLLKARELPILPLFELLRHQLMDWYVRRQTLERNTLGLLVSPNVAKIQHLIQDRGRRYLFHSSDETFFEVETRNEYLVNLHNQTCSYYGWQKQGYPCGHALAIIMSRKQDPRTFAKPFFTLQAYRSTYETAIMHPLTGSIRYHYN